MAERRKLKQGDSIYHCMSRVVDRRFIFGDEEKEWFVRNMRKIEQFTGCEVLAYCVMSNHFHVLVHVPDADTHYISDAEVLDRIEAMYGKRRRREVEDVLSRAREQEWSAKAKAAILDQYRNRMNNLSTFMQGLKQRFSHWYNRRKKRKGTLWEERYKSVIVQGINEPLLTMAAYIELNPIRAGICDDPKEYRWCSFGAAFGGCKSARAGILRIFELLGFPEGTWRGVSRRYRRMVVGAGGGRGVAEDSSSVSGPNVKHIKRGIPQERIDAVLAGDGSLTLEELVRCRVRYFSDGMVIGTKAFVEEFFDSNRKWFGKRRRSVSRKLPGMQGEGLHSARDLRISPISAAGD